jgi:peptide/nickel transport system ATP-binding protein
MNSLLQVTSLQLAFRSAGQMRTILNDVSFSLHKGETLAIVGESGSGKSVTALSIMRLLSLHSGMIESGSILFQSDGQSHDLCKLPAEEMRRFRGSKIAMIFQEPMTSLNPVYTCGAQVAEAIRIHTPCSASEAKAKALHWFEEVKLPRPETLYNAYPHELSGGQKQRVMIAMAMCNHPDILIADEPTTALDVTVQKTILELMDGLKQKYGTSMIFISHDLGVVQHIADRVLVMYQGSIVESGNVEEVFEHPKAAYTKGLIACRPEPGLYPHRIPTLSDFMSEAGIHTTYISAEAKTEKAVARTLQPAVVKVRDLRVVYPGKQKWFGTSVPEHVAVDSVSFDVFPGEILGLVGESGCGKTSLSRALLRLQASASGSIQFKGQELLELSAIDLRALRPKMQLVFQDPYSALNPRMTAMAAIAEPVGVHFPELSKNEVVSRAEELMIQVGLDPALHGNRYPHAFSGGQRQRICIARALATQPEFLICDESVSALDVSVQAQILNLIHDLQDSMGFACIFISHDLQVVRYMSDRIMVMQNGRIVESGFTEAICNTPEHTYTQTLLASA